MKIRILIGEVLSVASWYLNDTRSGVLYICKHEIYLCLV
jgi:hypothetical protein